MLANEVKPLGIGVLIVEPGGFRTDWQGSSMQLHPAGPDYDQTVGEFNRMREKTNGTQPGDPVRGARIIVDVARAPQPPCWLLLGAQAVVVAREAAAIRAAELEQWADISGATDFPSVQQPIDFRAPGGLKGILDVQEHVVRNGGLWSDGRAERFRFRPWPSSLLWPSAGD